MVKLGRHVLTAALLLRSVASADVAIETSQPASPSATAATISTVSSASTCRSRTINYITHRLPQQCLKTSWSASASATPLSDSDSRPSESDPKPVTTEDEQGIVHKSNGTARAPQAILDAPDVSANSPSSSEVVVDTATSASEAAPSTSTDAEAEAEAEADSPLDNANFLSFEEWKKQNLAKAGQSPENVGQGRASAGNQERKPRPAVDQNSATKEAPPSYRPRSKDAGKTCKERFNYASFDCAATVLKTNPQCKSSSSLLVENKDSYMLNECAAQNKFVIVELCDDILVDTVVLANFEFFSSMFRTFRISVSDRYPVKLERWKELGIFEARNSRDIQAFLVENPLIWARYLRIEFLSHYGNEFYCPVSLLRVHGTTMMEEFRHQEEAARGEDDNDEVVETEGQVIQAVHASPQDKATVTENVPDVETSKASDTGVGTSENQSASQPSADPSRSSAATQPPAAQPTTQESFFKSIHKRLQMLESNSTLSLQYIEEQSRILRDAFSKVEKRQLGKTEKFLDHLNNTVMAELVSFRQQYDQLWQSTVIELENRREQHEREMLAISARLTLLADELVFQKRMAVVQSTLILLCLGLVLFVRSGSSYLELPLVQQMMHKSQSALRLQFDSPSNSPPRNRHRRNSSSGDGRKRFRIFGLGNGSLSDASPEGPRSPTLEFSPPTPTSDESKSSGSRSGSVDGGLEPLRQTQSGPSTPSGLRDAQASWMDSSEGDLRPLAGGGQASSRRRSPLRSGESVDDFYEDGQSGNDSRKASADPNQLGDSGGSVSDSGSDCVHDVSD
ncbi:uncharacterized protein K452DRAFT_269574 [Aplosporella prunicola CBS 121167]|uniref:SUN domain-containing protein n=1 Tax=Aplosporella prunicola CBS 121167 TaxID=1176127 RepID=A0A6A6BK75_9PEZI|nr:uncharacterized protein K452DRAFT_269574 [Aplosporella prunicola CBS 121167]KAF2142961.1 hypothetical protein K452DRAFT_269574 [Aplosporella prunicola CBS 121167]